MDEVARRSREIWSEAISYEPPLGDDLEKAIALHEKALEVDSRNILSLLSLAEIYAMHKIDLEKAEYCCSRGYAIKDTPPEIKIAAHGVSDVLEENADDLNHAMMIIRGRQERLTDAEEYLAKMKIFLDKYGKGHYHSAVKHMEILREMAAESAKHERGAQTVLNPKRWSFCVTVANRARIDARFGGRCSEYDSSKYALKCRACESVMPFPGCSNCGAVDWGAGLSPDSLPGLFCRQCERGFVRWKCPSCDTDNAVNNSIAKKKGCFVATAAFGTPVAEEVRALCTFRDTKLTATCFGRVIIKMYYFVSPTLARSIERGQMRRAVVRFAIRVCLRLIHPRQ